MNRLALGTAQLGSPYGLTNSDGQVTLKVANDMLNLAKMNGIDTIDTAINYGESEIRLGNIGTSGFNVITKLPSIPNNCANIIRWVEKQLKASLSRLNVDSIYGLLLHEPNTLLDTNGFELYRAICQLKEKRLIRKIGVSIYSPKEMDLLIPKYNFDLVQAPFNLVDQRLWNSGWLYRLKDKGIEVHTRSAFLQGLLLIASKEIPIQFIPWKDIWIRWQDWIKDHNTSALKACLSFPLSYSEIDKVVVGTENLKQLEQIINMHNHLPRNNLPNLFCNDEFLINPSMWSKL